MIIKHQFECARISTRYPTTRSNTRKSMDEPAPKKLYTFKDILNEFKTLNQV